MEMETTMNTVSTIQLLQNVGMTTCDSDMSPGSSDNEQTALQLEQQFNLYQASPSSPRKPSDDATQDQSGVHKIYSLESAPLQRYQAQSCANELLMKTWPRRANLESLFSTIANCESLPSKMTMGAVWLAQIGAAYHDEQLIARAMAYVQGAQYGLRRSLNRYLEGLTPWQPDLVWTPRLLALCGHFTFASSTRPTTHITGFISLAEISDREPRNTELSREHRSAEMIWLAFGYFYILENALFDRKAVSKSYRAQLIQPAKSGLPIYPLLDPEFIDATIAVPLLLEDFDRALPQLEKTASNKVHHEQKTRIRITDLVTRLQRCLERLQAIELRLGSSGSRGSTPTTPIEQLPTSYPHLDELSLRTFPGGLTCAESDKIHVFLSLSTCALRVLAAIHALHVAAAGYFPFADRFNDVLWSATMYADNICKCAIYLHRQFQAASITFKSGIGSVQLALDWYLETRDLAKIAWCRCFVDVASQAGLNVSRCASRNTDL